MGYTIELASKMLINFNYTFNTYGSGEHIFDLMPDLNRRRHVYLIFKEALNNIIKHSGADEVSIILSVEDNKFKLTIEDNGKGFVEEEIDPGEGLNNLRNRSQQVGAKIIIESNCTKGTLIILELPL